MQCQKCNVKVSGSSHCPLCQCPLNGAGDETGTNEPIFPVIPFQLRSGKKSLIRLIAFATIAVATLSVAVNISFQQDGGLWSLFVIAGLASLWSSFLVINDRWWNIPKIIFFQLLLIAVLVLLWDIFTGFYKWSLNFVLPILFSCSMVALAVFAKVRNLKVQDYSVFLGIISLISIFSLLLIVFRIVSIVYPALLCFSLSIISLASLIIFQGKSLLEELQRRLHL
ncbi:DUF6320 domain-containing protein [Breznakiellaceae bacterium SP9]